ncbi:NUDIX domain-containing protein [Candidatus Woesearchaeota archaeon]|nr:NUDIX domain-containing protein [Candidatus Woesearchaeota archaeon]
MTDKIMGAGFGIMILKDNKVLLGKRHDDAEKADSLLHGEGTWTMPGGKLHFGEELKEAAVREVLEETGIILTKEQIKAISVTNDVVHDAHFVTVGFLCENCSHEPKVMEPDEITEWKWFELSNLPKKVYFPSMKIIKNFLDKEFYKH